MRINPDVIVGIAVIAILLLGIDACWDAYCAAYCAVVVP